MKYILQTDSERIEITIIRSRRRTLGLEVKGDGTVNARVPMRAPREIVERFIEEHKEWILKKRCEWGMNKAVDSSKILPAVGRKEGKQKIKKLIEERVAYYARIMGVTYQRISMRNQKTRWGSCSSEGNLNFHWKLVLMPPEVLDYVVVHELAHRKEMNHSRKFWAEVKNVLPDYEKRRKWLKEFGGYV